jgi:predicted Zn-dependent protease
MTGLKDQQYPPYFMSYSITEQNSDRITATFGKIESDISTKKRILDIDLRVGSYQLDNTHIIRGAAFSFGSGRASFELPLENDEASLRQTIWHATDQTYKTAIEKYEKALTNKAVKVKEEDSSADFSQEKPSKYIQQPAFVNYNKAEWQEKLRRLSALFIGKDWIYDCNVILQFDQNVEYFLSSEGSEVQLFEPYFRIMVIAKTKADDGMSLPLYQTYFSFTPEGLPSDETITKDINTLIAKLDALRKAPIMKTYSGPAMLSGEASGVFFHEIFGHRAEGHRQKDPTSSQTLKNFVGKPILPDFIDVVFDPHATKLGNIDLSGHYEYDDQGVKAETVHSVEKGIFKDFLMCRSPIENFLHSNGHGRKQAGYFPVSRQSNLIVKASKTVSVEKMKNMLRDECKKQDKEFGLYFEKVQGGFTFTGTTIPNAFNVDPLVVYKIYVDGRPDEVVRGVDLIGTPLTTFSNIIAAGDDVQVFNGICGAESGGVPVSASSPSMLVSQIEAQRKSKSQAQPPILAAP